MFLNFRNFIPKGHEIRVENLSYDATESDLQSAFGVFGIISRVKICKSKVPGGTQSAFVSYLDESAAVKAVSSCQTNAIMIRGNRVRVKLNGSSAGNGDASRRNPNQLFIRNQMPFELDERTVRDIFSRYGPVIHFIRSNKKLDEGVLTFGDSKAVEAVLRCPPEGDILNRIILECKPRFTGKASKKKRTVVQIHKPALITEFRFEINYQDGDPVNDQVLYFTAPDQDSSFAEDDEDRYVESTLMSRRDFLESILESCPYYRHSSSTPRRFDASGKLNRFLDNRNLYSENGLILYAYFRMDTSLNAANSDDEDDQDEDDDVLVKKSFKKILDTIKTINDQLTAHQVDSNVSIHFKRDQLFQASHLLRAFGLQFGNLSLPNKYCFNTNPTLNTNSPVDNVRFKFDDSDYKMDIWFAFANMPIRLEIPFYIIEDRIMFVNDREDRVELVIPCSKPPFVFCIDQLNLTESYDWAQFVDSCEQFDETELTWSRFFLPNSVWSIKIAFRKDQRVDLINQLARSSRIRLIFSHIESEPIRYTMEHLRRDLSSTCFNTRYFIECLLSQYEQLLTGKVDRLLAEILNALEATNGEPEKIVPKVIENFSNKIAVYKSIRFHQNLYELLQESVEEELTDQKWKKAAREIESDTNEIMLVRQATFTPSRTIFYFPQLNQSNRVLRQFGSEVFLRMKFMDEDLQRFNSKQRFVNMDSIFEKMKAVLENGIAIQSRKYEFLAMSASQMRSHGCWMVFGKAQEIRDWMGDFSKIRCVGKYAARLGQSLSTSIEGFDSSEYCEIPDKLVTHKGVSYNFTDGIGKISLTKALEIKETLGLESLPSAFQIRYRGYKGVVSVDPTIDLEYADQAERTKRTRAIQLRESMRKFESTQSKMDVLNYSKYIPCFLNRQVIQILSALGIKESVFEYFQDLMLKRLINIFVDPKVTEEYIKQHYASQKFAKFLRQSQKQEPRLMGTDYAREPFFHDILVCIHKRQSEELIKKSRIFVANGRILLGTIDEWGVLEEDEVFIQCSQVDVASDQDERSNREKYYSKKEAAYKMPNAGATFILDCPVVVTKNPAMVAGDLRVLKAVHKRELEHMVDCIVFPAKGTRPISNMCSGSDLDGDLYWVTWDKLLIPAMQDEPLEYDSGKANELSRPIEIRDIIEFFVNFIKIDQLGAIANAHTAIEDTSQNGLRDEACKKLANLFCTAVDFVKTGILPEIPYEIWQMIDTYPDYMEKHYSRTHRSKKVIGKMYRKCKSVFINEDITFSYDYPIELNTNLLVTGYDKYLEEAREAYSFYRKDLERIMNHFGLKHESELFSGKFMTKNSSHAPISQDEEKEFHKTCQEMLNSLWIRLREEFFSEFLSDQTSLQILRDEPVKKASAWYHACYTSSFNKKKRILSFPWIVQDVLMRSASARKASEVKMDRMSWSACKDFIKSCNFYNIKSIYIQKLIQIDQISRYVSRLGDTVKLFIGHLDEYLLAFETNRSRSEPFKLICITTEEVDEHFLHTVLAKLENNSWKKKADPANSTILIESACQPSISIHFISEGQTTDHLRALENHKAYRLIRLNLFRYPELVVIVHFVLKLMHSDSVLIKSLIPDSASKQSITEYLIYMVIEFCKSNGLVVEQDQYAPSTFDLSEQNLANSMLRSNLLEYLLESWNRVHGLIERLVRQKSSQSAWHLSDIVMKFYKDNAFEQMSNCPVVKLSDCVSQRYFENAGRCLKDEQIKALRDHFFKGIHILLKSPDVSDSYVWNHDIRSHFEKLHSVQTHLDGTSPDRAQTALAADMEQRSVVDGFAVDSVLDSIDSVSSSLMVMRRRTDGQSSVDVFDRIESSTFKLEKSSVLMLSQFKADTNNNPLPSDHPSTDQTLFNRFYLDSMKGILNAHELDDRYPKSIRLKFRLTSVSFNPAQDHALTEPIVYLDDSFDAASAELDKSLRLSDSQVQELEKLLEGFKHWESSFHQVVLTSRNESNPGQSHDYCIKLDEQLNLKSLEMSPVKWLQVSRVDEGSKAVRIELMSNVYHNTDGRDHQAKSSSVAQEAKDCITESLSVHDYLERARKTNKKLVKSLERSQLFKFNEETGQLELRSHKRTHKIITANSFSSALIRVKCYSVHSMTVWSRLFAKKALPLMPRLENNKLLELISLFIFRDTKSQTNHLEVRVDLDMKDLDHSEHKELIRLAWAMSNLVQAI